MNVKDEIKQRLIEFHPDWEEDRVEYEAEIELEELANSGNEEAIRELSKRVY